MYNASVSQPFQPSSIALFLLVVGCSSAQVSTTTDGSTDRPAADVPASPWQVEFGDGVTTLRAIWGSGPNDIYAVGYSNQILHSVGAGVWTLQTSPQGAAMGGLFEGVWGSGPNDIYVVGDETGVAHSSGDGVWTIDPDLHNQPLAIWGSGPNDVYVVGTTVAHKKL